MVQGEGDQLDQDLEENQSEKNVKYRDLRKREEAMDQVNPSRILKINYNSKSIFQPIKGQLFSQ